MAAGRLGVSNPTALTDTLVYTVPTGKIASINIAVVNTGLVPEKVTIWISDSTSTNNAKLIEYMVSVAGSGGVLEREGLLLTAGERVFVRTSSGTFAIRVHGFED